MTVTTLNDLINPQVMGNLIEKEIEDKMVFTELCDIDLTLVGTAGDSISLPVYEYIGDAAEVAEGAEIAVTKLSATAAVAEVKKVAKGIELTDEAVLSAYGDPVGEAAKQLGRAIANKVDEDVMAALSAIDEEMTVGDGSAFISADLVADALVKFGQLVDGEKVLVIAPAQLATLRKSEDWIKATDMGVNALTTGCIGMIHGCQVLVSSKVVATDGKYNNFIVMPGAMGLFMKREPQIEQDRNIVKKTTVITADQHYVAYLKDNSKAVKIVAQA